MGINTVSEFSACASYQLWLNPGFTKHLKKKEPSVSSSQQKAKPLRFSENDYKESSEGVDGRDCERT